MTGSGSAAFGTRTGKWPLPWTTNESKDRRRTVAGDTLSEYMTSVWERGGAHVCANCRRAIYYDRDSGYWIHAAHRAVDGHNGLYCSAEMWDDASKRVYARPERSEGAQPEGGAV